MMTDEELCGWLRSMLPASGFAPTENWAPWLGADRIEAQAAEIKAILDREADTYRRHDAKVDALEAENERLREALIVLAPMVNWLPHPDCITAETTIRAALGGTK